MPVIDIQQVVNGASETLLDVSGTFVGELGPVLSHAPATALIGYKPLVQLAGDAVIDTHLYTQTYTNT